MYKMYRMCIKYLINKFKYFIIDDNNENPKYYFTNKL